MVNWARENAGRAPSTMTPSSQEDARELKAFPFFGYAPGNYTSNCMECGAGILHDGMDKRALRCLEHAAIAAKLHIEALEEHVAAAERVPTPDRTDDVGEQSSIEELEYIAGHETTPIVVVKACLRATLLSLQRDRDALREALERVAAMLVDQHDEPWPAGSDADRLHYWRDKAIADAKALRALLHPENNP